MNDTKISIDGIKTIVYEDISCKVSCNVADFRDPVWWLGIMYVYDKKKNENIKVDREKKKEIYQKIEQHLSVDHNIHEIYTTEFGGIKDTDLDDQIFLLPILE